MNEIKKRILAKTLLVVGPAVIATFALSFSLRLAFGMPIDWLSWVECAAIPVLVGTPIAAFIFSQAERLQSALAELGESHRSLVETHDTLAFVTGHDRMTGLPNREVFLRRVEEVRRRDEAYALLAIDPDGFKSINDRFGYARGDEALIRVAKAIQYAVRPVDIVGRIAGDEFGVFLVSVGPDEAQRLAELIRRQVEIIPWHVDGARMPDVKVSVGGVLIPRCSPFRIVDVLRQADRQMEDAKRQGGNRVALNHALPAVA